MRPADGLQQVLNASERYRDIFNAAADAMTLRDENFRVVDVNAAFVSQTGYSREEAIGNTLVLGATSDADTIRQRHRRALAGETVVVETMRVRKDGVRIAVELRCFPIHHQGRPHVLYVARDISERKRAEEALRASEEQYRAIFNAASDAMVLRDAEFRVVDVNAPYVAQTGYAREEVVGRVGTTVTPPEFAETIRALHHRVLAGERVMMEIAQVMKDGTRLDMELRCTPVQHHGKPHVLYIGRDISARKKAEEALRSSEEQYRSIFNGAQDSMVLRDAGFRMVDVNAAWSAVTGFSREEAIGLAIVVGNDPPEFERLLREQHRKALAGRRSAFEASRTRRDGRKIDLELHALPVQYRGEPHVLFIGRDITERKRAEEALRVSEEQYRSIFNASVDGMNLRDAQFRVVDVNPAYERMSGFTRAEVLGKDHVVASAPELDEMIRGMHRRALAGELATVETQAQRKDRSRFEIELHAVPMQYRGEPHVLFIGRDITARKRAEEAMRVSEEQYRSIFNASQDTAVLRDADFRIVDVNAAWVAVTGFSREQALGEGRVLGNDPPEFERMLRAQHHKVLAGETIVVESERIRKDGRRDWRELRAVPVMHQGKPHVLYVGRDIGERRRVEEALRDSEEQYRGIFNASTDALTLRDAQFRVVDVNPAYERLSGYSREEVLGKDRVIANPPEMNEPIKALHRRALAGEPVVLETQGVNKDGTCIELELRGVPMHYRGEPHVIYIGRDISERKRAEAALRGSEEQYRAIFNASTDALILRDPDARLVDVNPAFLEMSGYARDEVMNETRWFLAQPAHWDMVKQVHARVIAGESVNFELPARHKDGSRLDLEVHYVPMRYRGRPHGLAMVRDITARKRAEEQLRSSEEQYRSIFNAAQDSMVLRDADLRVVDANTAYTAVTGYLREEVLGRDTVPTSPPELLPTIQALHRRALAGEPVHFELPARHKDGRGFDLELRGVPAQHQGRPHVLYVARDISERKRAEEALRVSEEQYRSVFNATTEALVLRDTDGRVVDVNRAFLDLSGYNRDEVVGQTRWFFAGPEMSAVAKEMHARVCAGESVHFEVYGYRKDGSRLDVEMHAVPMLYRGKPHALGMARDITARKRADAERAQLEAQLRQAQKMEAIGHLTGGIAHDFNNILTSIQGYAQLAGERPSAAADAKLASYLDHVELACNRARELIQQMLVFSRGRRGAARAVALAPLVRQSIRLLRFSLPATLEIVPEFAPDLPAALLDPVQAEQVLMNLCINARDAMQGRGVVQVSVTQANFYGQVCASCRGAVNGRFVQLSVADAGPGIAPEVMERMFEPFFSTKETGRGTGMGLAIVHGIVHEHGGHVLVDSSPAGARFRLLFPAVSGLEVSELSPRRRALPAARLAGRVLLVDDEHMVARFMGELLQGWGLEVTAVNSATEARQAFTRSPQEFDLLLTDYTMPRMTGLDLARALRAERPELPVILYSGYTDAIPEAELGRVAVELVQKPIDPDALLAALRKHL